MSNNMKEHNRALFARLLAQVPAELQNSTQIEAVRYISTTPDEKQRLKNAKILAFETPLPNVCAMCITDGASHFVCWSSDHLLPQSPIRGIVCDRSSCAGLSTYLWSDARWPVRNVDRYSIANDFLSRTGAFRRSEVESFFAPTAVLEVEEGFIKGVDGGFSIQRAYAATALSAGRTGLPLTSASRTRLCAILEADVGAVVADQMFRATSAMHWEHIFLDLYRCLERLYSIPYVQGVKDSLQSMFAMPPTTRTSALEELFMDSLSWRPKELDALVEVLRKCQDTSLSRVLAVFCPPAVGQDKALQVARLLYGVRNDCAHFRGGTRRGSFRGDWAALIDSVVELVNDALNLYGHELL